MAANMNKELGTTEVKWNLTDLYLRYDDPVIESDITFCQDEIALIVRDRALEHIETIQLT